MIQGRTITTPRADAQPLSPKGLRTRGNILDAALRLFSRSGTNSVSLRSIAAEAGITHAGVLRYFANKDELVIAALRHRDVVDVDSHLPHFPSGNRGAERENAVLPTNREEAREIILALVEVLQDNESRPGLVSLFVKTTAESTDPEHVAHEIFARRYRNLRAALGTAFRIELAENDDSADPDLLAVQALSLADGAQIQWLLDPTSTTPAEPVTAFLTQVGILPFS